MPSCREIDPLFAAYVDGEASADQRAAVDAHLKACPKCRHQTALQTVMRDTVREKLCRPCAPDALRARCRAAAHPGIFPFRIPQSRLASFSIAAALTFVLGGVLLFSLTGLSPTVLAAQLTLDHLSVLRWTARRCRLMPAPAKSNTRATTGVRFGCRAPRWLVFSSSGCAGVIAGKVPPRMRCIV